MRISHDSEVKNQDRSMLSNLIQNQLEKRYLINMKKEEVLRNLSIENKLEFFM